MRSADRPSRSEGRAMTTHPHRNANRSAYLGDDRALVWTVKQHRNGGATYRAPAVSVRSSPRYHVIDVLPDGAAYYKSPQQYVRRFETLDAAKASAEARNG